MTLRTVKPTDYEAYLEHEYPDEPDGLAKSRAADEEERQVRVAEYPFGVVLQVAYPELDNANRWCWRQFGPAHGECWQSSSEYPACGFSHPHSHLGGWMTHWLAKTDYDFGFNEWNFKRRADRDHFLEFVPQLDWGEKYPK